ncbi:MAG: prepilin-type N-terminal cleavage/methylation domain-containing protein [Lentisphaeria bacterium]|nr:prepilin-type N-terminal cleavage/methylation domain-containing protein [Candidatus Neomarinimicrobiota bacterium]MCF7842508.1 prepilin-type N-terminal cleavage/methylation domain-containing protein [Lentisphaeria bacterium]
MSQDKNTRLRHQKQRGFTLLELVATMGIIAILASIILPRYNQFTVQARISKTKMNLVTLKTGFANYYYQMLLEGEVAGFPATPPDSQLTTEWSQNTILDNGLRPVDLFSEEEILYNPNNNPYLYYTLPPDSTYTPGFALKDPDYNFEVKFRP